MAASWSRTRPCGRKQLPRAALPLASLLLLLLAMPTASRGGVGDGGGSGSDGSGSGDGSVSAGLRQQQQQQQQRPQEWEQLEPASLAHNASERAAASPGTDSAAVAALGDLDGVGAALDALAEQMAHVGEALARHDAALRPYRPHGQHGDLGAAASPFAAEQQQQQQEQQQQAAMLRQEQHVQEQLRQLQLQQQQLSTLQRQLEQQQQHLQMLRAGGTAYPQLQQQQRPPQLQLEPPAGVPLLQYGLLAAPSADWPQHVLLPPLPHAHSAALLADPHSLHESYAARLVLPPSLRGTRPHGSDTGSGSSSASGKGTGMSSSSGIWMSSHLATPAPASTPSPSAAGASRRLTAVGESYSATSNFTGSPRLANTGGVKVVCISAWTPMALCDPAEPQDTYTGFFVELFRLTADELGWSPSEWTFRCMTMSDRAADMRDTSGGGECYMSAQGSEVTNRALALGLKFSVPLYRTGATLLVRGSSGAPDIWAMFKVFDWAVWLALGLTAVGVAVIIYFLERLWLQTLPPRRESVAPAPAAAADGVARPRGNGEEEEEEERWYKTLWLGTYDTTGLMLGLSGPEGASVASKVVIMGYGLLVVLMLALFTANTAAQVTTSFLTTTVSSPEQLVGKTVATWRLFYDRLVDNYGYSANDLVELDANIDCCEDVAYKPAYLNDAISAIILPEPLCYWLASRWCDAVIAGGTFETVFLAFQFPAETPDEDIYTMSAAVVAMDQRSYAIDEYKQKYVQALDDSPCPTPVSQRVIETDVVSFYAVSGLWVILAATVLFAVLLLAVRYAVLLARSSGRPAAGAPPPGQYPYRAAATAVAPWAPPSKPKAEADAAQSGGGAAAAAFSDGTGASTHGATLGGKAAGHAGVDSFAAAVAADGGKPLGATTAALRAAALGLSLPSSAGADAELGSENCSERSTPGAPPLHRPLFSLSSADDLPPPAFPDVRQKSQSGGVGNRGTPAEQQPLADELLPKRQSGSGRRSAGSAGAGSPATPPQLRPGSELRPSSGLRPGSGVQPGSGVRPVSGSGAAAQPVATAGVGGQPAAAPQARAGTVPGVPHVTNQAPSESQFPYGEKDSEV